MLVTGTKYYGSHLGPFKTPARESDPRHMPPDYYFDQIDWLTAFQTGKPWDWVELRPQTLCGFAPGTAMSILPAIAVYAAISRELGLPLRFPGKPGAYTSLYQVTESSHFANATLWAATEPRCGLEAFNITNGDYFRWHNLWPRIAEVFDMPAGEPQTISLVQHMGDKADLWRAMTDKHGLKPFDFDKLVAWPFADYVFGCDWDVMSDVTKSRRFGFHDVVDSEEMFTRLLRRFRAGAHRALAPFPLPENDPHRTPEPERHHGKDNVRDDAGHEVSGDLAAPAFAHRFRQPPELRAPAVERKRDSAGENAPPGPTCVARRAERQDDPISQHAGFRCGYPAPAKDAPDQRS